MSESRIAPSASAGTTQRPDLGAQEVIGAAGAERREGVEIARIDEREDFRRIGEVADLALARRNARSDRRHQSDRRLAPLFGRQTRRPLAAKRRRLLVLGQPFGGAVDDAQRQAIAVARRVGPGEQPVAGEHHAGQAGILARQAAELEAEIEARTLPRQPADLVAENPLGQRPRIRGRRDGDHRVRMHMVDMRKGREGMQRRVDRRGARIEIENAMGVFLHHSVFVAEPAVERLQALEVARDRGWRSRRA